MLRGRNYVSRFTVSAAWSLKRSPKTCCRARMIAITITSNTWRRIGPQGKIYDHPQEQTLSPAQNDRFVKSYGRRHTGKSSCPRVMLHASQVLSSENRLEKRGLRTPGSRITSGDFDRVWVNREYFPGNY